MRGEGEREVTGRREGEEMESEGRLRDRQSRTEACLAGLLCTTQHLAAVKENVRCA